MDDQHFVLSEDSEIGSFETDPCLGRGRMLKQAFAVSDACAASEKDRNRSNKTKPNLV